jgi:hypothetical protein
MIIPTDELKAEFPDVNEVILVRKAKAVEIAVRAYTNNPFQNRSIRGKGFVDDGVIVSNIQHLSVGDTIQLSESINNGLYVVTEIDCGIATVITVDKDIFDEEHCLVTKIEYPADVVEGAINMLRWDIENRAKVGIKSESLSRKSTTYYDMDADNSLAGYPASLIGFLKPYMKARF